jgi:carbamoyltransferase
MNILGVHHGHDSSAAMIIDGKMVAAASEERFTRIKNDSSFPINAIAYCLQRNRLSSNEIDVLAVAKSSLSAAFTLFFDIPAVKSDKKYIKRLVKNYIKRKLPTKSLMGGAFPQELPLYQKKIVFSDRCKVHCCEHHLAHAASAFYTSGSHNGDVLIVTMDGRGDQVSSAIWIGRGTKIEPVEKYSGESSIGWFYGNATEALGWRHGSDEWKVMGLAPYGTPQPGALKGLYPEYRTGKLSQAHEFGNFMSWNDHGANHFHGRDAILLAKKAKELGRENYASEVQRVVEEQSMEFIVPWLEKIGTRDICCAGGCFLNVKLNQKLWYTGKLDNQWIFPNAGDGGLAVGAALHAYYTSNPSHKIYKIDNVYWGPEYSNDEIEEVLRERGLVYEYHDDVSRVVAEFLAKDLAVGWFQGRMEDGPRALGARSILMSPLKAENKDIINAKVKYREAFRPFCPAILYEKASEYLVNYRDEPFMITSFDVQPSKRDVIPAVVHVDGTLRPQLVKKEINPRYYAVIEAFGRLTGEYAILNTSFNVKGEPIVCSPRDAVRCFFDTGLDILCIGNFIVKKPCLIAESSRIQRL